VAAKLLTGEISKRKVRSESLIRQYNISLSASPALLYHNMYTNKVGLFASSATVHISQIDPCGMYTSLVQAGGVQSMQVDGRLPIGQQ
jgi:hypothetical protein